MADATTSAHHHLHLKLIVDPKARRMLFAEASGDAIEFLHSLLVSPHVSLPFDEATRNACIANVYESIGKLRTFAAVTANVYDSIEKLRAFSGSPPPSTVQRQQEEERFFVCGGVGAGNGSGGASSCGGYVAVKSGARCPSCGGEMAVEVLRGCPGASCSDAYAEPGVKGPDLTCILFDDLSVTPTGDIVPMASNFPMSLIAPGSFQETVVCLGYTEAMEILRSSLMSSTVLTDVFLCKDKEAPPLWKVTYLALT